MRKHRTKFHRWLLSKYQTESLSEAVQKFANECKPPVSHNTVLKWAEGSKPRSFYSGTLKSQFPECPLFVSKSQ